MNRFTSLPAEIVNEIAFLADKSTLLALCRVCKATNSPATRTLYRYLLLESPRQVVQCLKALLKNDYAAKSCRAFGIECQIDVTQALHLNNFFRLIAKALVRIRMVEAISLTISHWFPGAIRLVQAIDFILKDCTFPHLEHAHLQMAVTPTVASFLERHQKTLKSVVLCPRGVGPSSLEESSVQYHFPRLANVRATASVALPFFKAISGTLPALTSLDINWDPFDMVDHKQLIDAVRKKDAPLDMVTFLRTGWNKELIEEMSLCFPHIRDLSICSYLAIGLNTTVPPDLIDDIAKNLKRFKSPGLFLVDHQALGNATSANSPRASHRT
ncbi:hypothetical protein VNI00_000515 [Paramarasmius palmivorus]|uniref:F-box domain-containing protein n=1 Tax=Paramarasmius palmivorus TaxID=297713 RepID=A0AAW0E6E2_9AGAR